MNRELVNIAHAIWGLIVYTNPVESADAKVWRKQDLARIAGAPGIDPKHLGKLLGVGLQHRIYEYEQNGEPMVMKLSTPNRLLRFPSAQEAQEDIHLVAEFLKPFAVEPAEVVPLRDGTYAVKQRRLGKFRPITPTDLQNEDLQQQFADIVRRNREMMRGAGRSLDFMGREGQRKTRAALLGLGQTPTISNLVVESQVDGSERIRILDTDLENFYPGARSPRDLWSGFAAHLAVEINRVLIKRFFGMDTGQPRQR